MGELFSFSDTSWLTSSDGQHKLLFDLTANNTHLDLLEANTIRCLTGAPLTERLRITADGNVGIGATSIHNPQGWNKVVDILGANHARLNVRSTGGVVTSVFSHDSWNGQRGVIGTESNHPLTFATNYVHRMTIGANGSVGIGITEPRTPLHVLGRISTGADFTSAGAITFYPPDGFAWFHIDNGPAGGRPLGRLRFSYGGNPGDFEVMSMLQNGNVGVGTANPGENLTVAGSVRLGAGGAPVFIGGNQNGPFMQLHDDLWFSDPQNGTIQIRNGNNSNWGTLVGWFSQPSSIEYKKDMDALREPDLALLLDDALNTDVVRFRYKGDGETSRLRLGVIVEDCPAYLVGEDGKSLSTTEYIAMLHGAVKVLARRLAVLERRQSVQEVRA